METGKPYELELQAIRGDGTLLWTYARGESIRDATGCVRKLRGTLEDVADRKQAEEALRRALDEVSQLKNKLEQENIYCGKRSNWSITLMKSWVAAMRPNMCSTRSNKSPDR
jgi:hypothetical protein